MSDPDFDKIPVTASHETPRPPAADAYGAGPQIASISRLPHLRDYVMIVYKRRWLVLTAFLLVAVLTAVSTYTAVPVYQANVKLLIDESRPQYVQFQGANPMPAEASYYYLETQYDLLKSRALAGRTLDDLRLWDNMPPKNAPKSFDLMSIAMRPVTWAQNAVAGALRDEPSTDTTTADAAAHAESAAQSRAIDALLGMIRVQPLDESRIVTLSARSFDPKLATDVVNAHAVNYIRQNTEFKYASTKQAADWLNEKLAEQRKAVDAAEMALQKYRESNTAIPPEDTQNITVQKLSQLNTAYTTAKLSMLDKEVAYKQLEAIGSDEAALAAFPPTLANTTIQEYKTELANLKRAEDELLQTLDINHPKARAARASIESTEAKIRTEMQNVVKAIRTDFEAVQAQEKNLAVALQAQKDEALTMSQEGIQFGILEREVDSTRLIFQSLLQSAKETDISTEQKTTNVRIVDEAEQPRGPISPNRPLNMTMGLFGGLALGLVLALFFEYFDDRIKNPGEIKAYLGVPLLGLLPTVRGLTDGKDYPKLGGPAWPKLNEAFRSLRTNVIFSSADRGCRSQVITSTGPNEGKTVVASNFATSLAETGLRVLLIDADMRRPLQHRIFEVDQEPGLSNLLVGGVKPSEAIRKTSVPGLWLLPAGRVPPNPAELLGSPRFRVFFKSFGEHFDWVIIDTPPVMAVADAAVVAHITSGVVFVVRAEAVGRLAAQTALEQLDNARANIVGAVLNRVDLDRHAYYYSQYYRKEYADYYAAAPKV